MQRWSTRACAVVAENWTLIVACALCVHACSSNAARVFRSVQARAFTCKLDDHDIVWVRMWRQHFGHRCRHVQVQADWDPYRLHKCMCWREGHESPQSRHCCSAFPSTPPPHTHPHTHTHTRARAPHTHTTTTTTTTHTTHTTHTHAHTHHHTRHYQSFTCSAQSR